MGSPLLARAPPGPLLAMGERSRALLAALLALALALPLARAAQFAGGPERPDSSSEEDFDSHLKRCCMDFCYPKRHPECTDVCGLCCNSNDFPRPKYCRGSTLELAAQIALGAALVVAVAALVSIILRTCSRGGRRQRTAAQRRQQFRVDSSNSLDAYVAQRMHDCPPTYDDISWEKPPSYGNLQALEGSSDAVNDRRDPSSPTPYLSQLSDPACSGGGAAPPPYGGVFSISLQVHQREAEAASDDGPPAAAGQPPQSPKDPGGVLLAPLPRPGSPASGPAAAAPIVFSLDASETAAPLERSAVSLAQEAADPKTSST